MISYTKRNDIANQFRQFYQKLYYQKSEDTNIAKIKKYLENINLPRVSENENENLTRPITEEVVSSTIQKQKNGKCPGSDGYTNEFYKEFKTELVPILCRAINWALENKIYAPTWNTSIITVIPKEGKDPEDCASYRPISLLNGDQKILTSIIANRLALIIPSIINNDQTGFVPNRLLSDNIRRTFNIIEHATKQQYQTLLLTLDAEKAFDRVAWQFIF